MTRQYRLLRWLLPLAGLVMLVGYFGPWINHAAAGLVVTGLDLAEYVKFLPGVRSGEISVRREAFYLPLIAVSLTWGLIAFRREFHYGWPMSSGVLLGAAVAALNLLPPAWTPRLLLTPEFRLQTGVMTALLGVIAVSPLVALLPRRLAGALIVLSASANVWMPVRGFLRVLPDITRIYAAPQHPGWGMWVMLAGTIGLAAGGVLLMVSDDTINDEEKR
ncbi:MAG: hypothetical protein H6642_03555 [Caldilineaceae bacterium]|nr:hypothetical protein [Caldilineaceae bacterium]